MLLFRFRVGCYAALKLLTCTESEVSTGMWIPTRIDLCPPLSFYLGKFSKMFGNKLAAVNTTGSRWASAAFHLSEVSTGTQIPALKPPQDLKGSCPTPADPGKSIPDPLPWQLAMARRTRKNGVLVRAQLRPGKAQLSQTRVSEAEQAAPASVIIAALLWKLPRFSDTLLFSH